MPMRRSSVSWILLCFLPASLLGQGEVRIHVPLTQLQAAAVTDSNDPAAHYNLAVGLMSVRRWAAADTELRVALTLDPRFASADLALAYLPYLERPALWNEVYDGHLTPEWHARVDEAERRERAAYLIDPLVDRKILGAARPRVGWIYGANELGDVFNLLFQGLADLEDGKYDDAYQRFDRLAEMNQLHWFRERPLWIYWYRGNAAAQLGRWDAAIADIQLLYDAGVADEKADTTVRVPLHTNDYRYVLALFHQKAGHLAEAERLYRETLSTDVGMYMANVHLAEIFEARQQWPEAAAQREAAVAADPDDPSLLLDWGVTLGKGGRFADAEARFQEAIQAQPRDARSYFWLGVAQQQLGKGPEARTSFQHFIAVAPSRYAPQIGAARQRLAQLP
jgi:tetratricopeptide (TPR) repeat protein